MNELIINFTPTGMLPVKSQTPHVPITPDEIIADVREAWELGITMVHLHCRDKDGQPHYDREIYRRIIAGIRDFAPSLVICVSTSGRIYNTLATRSDVLLLEGDDKPDMASLTLSSLNFNTSASISEPTMIMDLAAIMKERGIKPELEAFDSGMLNYAGYLIKKQLITPPYYFNLILGNIACAQANLLSAGIMVNELPAFSLCSFGGVGQAQLKTTSMAISMGYGIRVGLEDNIWFDLERTKLATNIMLLNRTHDIARANQRAIMSSEQLRLLLNLRPGNGLYGTAE